MTSPNESPTEAPVDHEAARARLAAVRTEVAKAVVARTPPCPACSSPCCAAATC